MDNVFHFAMTFLSTQSESTECKLELGSIDLMMVIYDRISRQTVSSFLNTTPRNVYIFSLHVMRQKRLSQSQIVKLHVIRIFLKLWLDIIMFQDWISGKQAKPNGDNDIENGPVLIAYLSVYWFQKSALHFCRSSVQGVLFCDKAT